MVRTLVCYAHYILMLGHPRQARIGARMQSFCRDTRYRMLGSYGVIRCTQDMSKNKFYAAS